MHHEKLYLGLMLSFFKGRKFAKAMLKNCMPHLCKTRVKAASGVLARPHGYGTPKEAEARERKIFEKFFCQIFKNKVDHCLPLSQRVTKIYNIMGF